MSTTHTAITSCDNCGITTNRSSKDGFDFIPKDWLFVLVGSASMMTPARRYEFCCEQCRRSWFTGQGT